MKALLLAGTLVLSLSLHSQTNDSLAIVKLLQSDYSTMGNWDLKKHVSNCTTDYLLIEEGEVWDMQREKQYYTANSTRQLQRKDVFTFYRVKISGQMAYAVYFLKSEITEKGVLTVRTWNESAAFRKINGVWKIALIHSTPSK